MLMDCLLQDEVDSLGQSRCSSTDAGARRLLTELLMQFTRTAGEEGVYVFGATNRMQVGSCMVRAGAQQIDCNIDMVRCQHTVNPAGCPWARPVCLQQQEHGGASMQTHILCAFSAGL
jgi:hypothetical protein